jgi:hypothetical protein
MGGIRKKEQQEERKSICFDICNWIRRNFEMIEGYRGSVVTEDLNVDVYVESKHKHRFKGIPPMIDGIKVTVRTDLWF